MRETILKAIQEFSKDENGDNQKIPPAAFGFLADSIESAKKQMEAPCDSSKGELSQGANILLGIALEYATQKDKNEWKLNRGQVDCLLNESLEMSLMIQELQSKVK